MTEHAWFLRAIIEIVRARLGCEQDLLDAIGGAIERDREVRRSGRNSPSFVAGTTR